MKHVFTITIVVLIVMKIVMLVSPVLMNAQKNVKLIVVTVFVVSVIMLQKTHKDLSVTSLMIWLIAILKKKNQDQKNQNALMNGFVKP
jgi:uncharacterized Tic20 family protein